MHRLLKLEYTIKDYYNKPIVLSSLCMRLLFVLSPGYCFTAEEGMEETEQQQTTGGCNNNVEILTKPFYWSLFLKRNSIDTGQRLNFLVSKLPVLIYFD